MKTTRLIQEGLDPSLWNDSREEPGQSPSDGQKSQKHEWTNRNGKNGIHEVNYAV